MFIRKSFTLVFSILFLISCANGGDNKLKKPVLTVNPSGTGLVWEKVEGATSYEITEITEDNYVLTTEEPSYNFLTDSGEHELSVVAVSKDKKSDPVEFKYETKDAVIDGLSFDGTKITWSSFIGADLYYRIYESEFIKKVEGNSLAVTESGIYEFIAQSGFDSEKNIFYPKAVSKTVLATLAGETSYILEDGTAEDDASLSEKYKKTKYTSSGWEVAGTTVALDKTNKGYTEGNAVAFKHYHHGIYFMFEKKVSIDDAFNTFTFSTKSVSDVRLVLSFQIKHTTIIGGVDLNGVYIKYEVPSIPTVWTKYTISMDDPNWLVNYAGKDYKFEDVASLIGMVGFKVDSLQYFFPFFDVFQFRINAVYKDGGPSATTFFDDVALINSDVKESKIERIIPRVSLRKSYAFKNEQITGNMTVNGGSATLKIKEGDKGYNALATINVNDDNSVSLISNPANEQLSFEMKLSSMDGGNTLEVAEVSGPSKELFKDLKFESVNLLEDFESYDSTGVGYDQAHEEAERTGLRGAYYADYYSGGDGDSSPVGGPKWKLMGSTDYSYLSTDVSHSGNKSINLKNSSNTMRFMTWALKDGAEEGVSGKYFSFWAKGGVNGDMTLRVSVYSTNQVTPRNQIDNSVRKTFDFPVTMNSDWTEYKLELDSSKLYYGFSFVTVGQYSGTQRIYVDDIYIYNDMSPWGN